MKTDMELYELGRDVNGFYSCCIVFFNGRSMELTFVGYKHVGNMARFIADNLEGYTYTQTDPWRLVIDMKGGR